MWWETHDHTGHDPIRGIDVTTQRRHIHVERDLPMKDDYRQLVDQLINPPPLARGAG